MEKYNYINEMTEAIKNYLVENNFAPEEYDDAEEAYDAYYDDMFMRASVTGNGSGSYWCNPWKAEECICHNLDLLGEAVAEFGGGTDVLKDGAEACDVTIRCYLLSRVLSDVLEEYYE